MIIADTGFWLALANRRDKYHGPASRALERLREPLVTTWSVLTETYHLLLSRLGPGALAKFVGAASRGAFELFDLSPRHLPAIATMMAKYRELPIRAAKPRTPLLATSPVTPGDLDLARLATSELPAAKGEGELRTRRTGQA